jgi:CRP-like cAMP-binding protein
VLSNEKHTPYDFDHMSQNPFSSLPPNAFRVVEMVRGDVLFRQNQKTSGLYKVVKGSVALRRPGLDGELLTLHRAAPGGYFAEASVFSDTYHCDATCTEEGSVLKIGKSNVLAVLNSDPSFSVGFTKLLAAQVQYYRAHVEILAIRSAKDRVIAAVRAGYLDSAITELASRINLTHEACYRALRELCVDGKLIQSGRGRYHLPLS